MQPAKAITGSVLVSWQHEPSIHLHGHKHRTRVCWHALLEATTPCVMGEGGGQTRAYLRALRLACDVQRLAQVDSALLAHPLVTEAVSFGAPDEKYGECVAAAVVLAKPVDDEESTIADIKKAAASKLSKFKVCSQPRPILSCCKGSEGVRWGPDLLRGCG